MKSTLSFLRWLYGYLKPYWYWVVVALFGMFLYAFSHAATVYLLHEVSREIFQGEIQRRFTLKVPELWGVWSEFTITIMEGTPFQILKAVLLSGGIILFIEVISEFIGRTVMKILSIIVGRDLRAELYENILDRPIAFFEQQNVGDLLSRVSADINQVKSAIGSSVRQLFQSPLEIISVLAVAVYAAPILSPALIIIPACSFLVVWVGKRVKKYSRQSQDVLGDMVSVMQERFAGIKLVKTFATEDQEKEDFNELNDSNYRKRRRQVVAKYGLKSILHAIIYSLAIGILYLGGLMVLKWGVLTSHGLIVFVASLLWVYKPIRKVAGVYTGLQSARGAASRVQEVFQETNAIFSELDNGDREPKFEQELRFDGVRYSYPSTEEWALDGIDFELNPGDRVALVGMSGAGKSTFIDLLLRFYDPTEGTIVLDGKPVGDYDLEAYRGMFGLVTQEPILFDDTITENIRYGREDISQEEVEAAARMAEAHQFIRELPEGYETMMGERGVRLSGGQSQRITLARALVGDPKVLVLDEATSSVDSESEEEIIKALQNLPDDLSVVTISHTLSTVQFVQEIIVLDDGKIEAQGSHRDLLERSDTYQVLCEHQQIT